MRASIKMIGVSNLQSFIASMTQKLTLSDISDESKNYLDKAGITTACLRIKSKWTAGGDRKSGSAGMPRPISYAVFCLKKNISQEERLRERQQHIWDGRNCDLQSPDHVDAGLLI